MCFRTYKVRSNELRCFCNLFVVSVSNTIPYLRHELRSKLLRVATMRDPESNEEGDTQRLQVIELLIKHGADVDYYKDGLPLLEAARREWFSAVTTLLAAGARRNSSEAVVPAAASRGHKDIVEILFNMCAYTALNKNRALRRAAARGHTAVVQFIITRGTTIDDTVNAALILAVRNGHEDTVNVLLEAGADVCAFDNRAFCVAVKYGHKDIFNNLLEHEAHRRVVTRDS